MKPVRIVGSRIWTLILSGLTVAILVWLCFYVFRSFLFEKNYNRYPIMIEGEYRVDEGDWKPILKDEPIDDTFHTITFRGKLRKDVLKYANIEVLTKNVWYQLYYEGVEGDERFLIGSYDYSREFFEQSEEIPEDRITETPGYHFNCFFLSQMDEAGLRPDYSLVVRYPYSHARERFSDCFRLIASDSDTVYADFFFETLPGLILFVLVCFLGIFLFPVVSFIFGKVNFRYLAFGLLCIFWGLYMVLKSASWYLNMWIDDEGACMLAGRTATLLFLVCLLIYFKSNLTGTVSRAVANGLIAVFFLTVVTVVICQVTGAVDLVETAAVPNGVFFCCCLGMMVLFGIELKKHRLAPGFILSWTPLILAEILDILVWTVGFPGREYITIGLAVTMVYNLVRIVLDLRRRYLETIRYQAMQRELYEAEVNLMVSQIRPHFVYNTLSSIAMLCKLDPDTAYEATINFSDYLRGNMDALKQTEPVPFSRELKHLKKYLYIEKLRFQDKLNIIYDIEAEDFPVPLLSIQPLVENAVKHGVGMKEEGGTVSIATRDVGDAYEVVITDDGVGFDPSQVPVDEGRSHVGMANTKKRLMEQCGAFVTVESAPGKGTTARIRLPKSSVGREPEEDENRLIGH